MDAAPLQTAAQLGRTLRDARRANGITLEDLSQRTGYSLRFLSEIERGKEGASIGRVLQVAAALGVEITAVSTQIPMLDVERFPELRLLMWQRGRNRYVSETDALALYEANWRFVDTAALTPHEADLLRQLAARHGRGVLNV